MIRRARSSMVTWPRAWLAAAVVVAVLVPVALWGWVSFQTRDHMLAVAVADERRVTDALGQQTLRLFETQALILDVADRGADVRDCPALQADNSLQRLLADAMRRSSLREALWILDPDGVVCASSSPTTTERRGRDFRNYFTGAGDAGSSQYFVGRAMTGPINDNSVFELAKPRMRDGAFNGVVLVSVNIGALTQRWRDMRDTPTQRFGLFRRDGAAIALSSPPVVPDRNPAAEQRLAATWQTEPAAGFIGTSLIDGSQRVGAWLSLPEWGVVVTSSVDEAAVLKPWRKSALIYGVVAALNSLLLGALAWSLLRGQRMLTRMVEQRTRALRSSEDRLKLFIDGAPGGIALFDRHMRYVAASRRYLQDYALNLAGPEALLGRSHYDVFPDISERWREIHRRVLAGETLSAEDDPFPRSDGRVDWVRWEMSPWYLPDGSLGGAVLFSEVVTARKQAELVLSRSKEELEQLVSARTRELEATQTRLAHAQRMEALGQLAGGIAHDFNNILQAVQGAAALAERRPADPDRVRSLARMIIEAAGRGAAVTGRLLAFSRQSDLQAEPVDAGVLLAGMQEILVHTIGAGIEVRLDVRAGLPPLLADKGQLETVLVNLATNARDAMVHGGTLTLAAAAETLRRDDGPGHPITLRAGSYIRLCVGDTGTGMTPEVLARASEPFFTTKGVGQGTGLGLAMARGFAEQSGGGLRIESGPGRGTVVKLWFPVTSATPAVLRPPGSDALDRLTDARARLLIVDDDAIVKETLAQQMEAEGYAVLTAGSAAEALTLLDTGEAVDLVVADFSMPGVDGVALIKEVRRRQPRVPAILLTGFAANATEVAVSGAIDGSFTLLRKPIAGPALAKRAAALLEAAGVG